ncbi:MAG: hydroxyacid dehydrogenase [Candidatus Omnitrophica bacterium]|nr:hydroxyacid dehydrogenase [Candidatus Omnitrophota bacterium]
MRKADVLFYEVFKEEKEAINYFLPKTINAQITSKTIQEEGAEAPGASLISVRTQSIIPSQWAASLKGVLTRSTGYEHLLKYRQEAGKNVEYGYLPSYCSRAVAEQAILIMLALWRKLTTQQKQFESFSRDDITGTECYGKNVLIVGVGRIGREIARMAKGLGMNVKGVDIEQRENNVEYISLEEGIAWAQCVVSAVPLTHETENMLDYSCLKNMPQGGIVVNVSRGEITPVAGLKKLLDEEHLNGIGLDVYQNEGVLGTALRSGTKLEDENFAIIASLKTNENVIFTPHNAFNTKESVERKAQQSVEAVVEFLKSQSFPDTVPDE